METVQILIPLVAFQRAGGYAVVPRNQAVGDEMGMGRDETRIRLADS